MFEKTLLFTKVGEGVGDKHNKGYFATPTALAEAYPEGEAGDFAVVESTDTVWIWDSDNNEWVDSDKKGQVTSVNNQTGDVVITGNDIVPSQTGNSGKFLTTNGTSISWADLTKVNTTVALAAADWSSDAQTVSVTGMTATAIVFVAPTPASQSDYTSAGIMCTAQAAGTLTFSCDTTPTNDIDVNVVML